VDWRKLKRGDIMLVFGNDWRAWIYAMKYSHAGNYDGSQRVYESNPSDGVRLKPLSNWQRPNIYIGLGRNNKKSESQVRGALDWAKGKYGDGRTPYNYVYPDKWTDSRLYCSQLVWKIHKYLGVDLDSNNWGYFVWAAARFGAWILGVIGPGVAPDEIGLSPSVAIYAEGWN
jgi:uncharacterized protein YycO